MKNTAIAALAVAAVATCVVAAPVLAGVSVASGVIVTATVVASSALYLAGATATAAAVVEYVENTSTKIDYKEQSVYIMRDKESNEVKYIGRTNDPVRRQGEHQRDTSKSDLKPLEVKITGLTVNEARIAEQMLISAYTINKLKNARREIAVGKLDGYADYIDSSIELFGSFAESEILCLMEG